MKTKYDRRAFLKGLGASAALLPMFDIELAHAAGAPKRFGAIVWPNGVVPKDFWPSGGESNFTMPDVLSPLQPHRDKLLIIDNLNNQAMMDQFPDYGAHAGIPYLLTGGPGKHYFNGEDVAISDNISIDQYIANDLQKQSTKTPIHSLTVGVDNKEETDPSTKYISFRGPAIGNQQNAPAVNDDVSGLYKQLFGNGPVQGVALDKVRAEQKSILDFVGKDLERFGARLGRDAKAKVETHLDTIRQIEKTIDAVPMGTSTFTPPKIDGSINSWSKLDYDKIAQAQTDMVVAAFASNQTQVATMLWSNGHNNTWVFRWLGAEFSQPGDGSFNPLRSHHEIAHRGGGGNDTDDGRRKNKVDKYFMSRFAYMIDKCKGYTEGGKPMIDNCVLLMINNMGEGGSHTNKRLPCLIAGSGGGYFRTGRYVKQSGDRAHNQVLTSVANAFGYPLTYFGQQKYGGALANLT